jgi:hypothetical protein
MNVINNDNSQFGSMPNFSISQTGFTTSQNGFPTESSTSQSESPSSSLNRILNDPNTVKLIGGLAAMAAVYYGGKWATNNPMSAITTLATVAPLISPYVKNTLFGGSKKKKNIHKKNPFFATTRKNIKRKQLQ